MRLNQFEPEPSSFLEAVPVSLHQDYTSFICHELRTPLTSIQGALGLLNSGHVGALSDEAKQILEIALRNTNRLTRLAIAIENTQPITLLSKATLDQFQLENELHKAIERQEFQLTYQPIVSIETNRILGFEALTQWQHPTRGKISPDIFIALAEKTGHIQQLGMWTLNQACEQLYSWQQEFPSSVPLSMSVNLSVLQLLQPTLVQDIQDIIQKTKIAPHSLKLEITESALIKNQQVAIAVLLKLRAMGVQLYVDDFGTGYSSLERLQNLPIDVLKIDRSFINGKQWDISEMILILAAKLGLGVIAEGVETAEELMILKTLGCQQMQGYFFSKPVDESAASILISQSFTSSEV